VQGVAIYGIALYWAVDQGGLAPTNWPSGALFLLGLGFVLVAFGRRQGASPPPRLVLVATASLGAFSAWSYASIAWAAVPGDAWEGANRTFLYFVVFALVALVPWRGEAVLATLGLYACGAALIGLVELASTASSSTPGTAFANGRFDLPVGYQNAEAALFLAAIWPLLAIAALREVPVVLRGLAIGFSTLLVELALLGQSRGSVIAAPLTLLIFVVLSPRRLRALCFVVPVVLATAVASPRVLDVYTTLTDGGGVHRALQRALTATILSAAAATVAGLALAVLDRRVAIAPRTVRTIAVVLAVVSIGGVAGAAVVAVRHDVSGHLTRAWDQFKDDSGAAQGSSHLTAGFGSNRYDFWRVAWLVFRQHPIAGVGADNFATFYVKDRKSDEEPRYPHSVELDVLSQTGAVGSALFVGGLGTALWLALRRRRRLTERSQAAAAAAVAMFVYWLLHGSVDWLWEFPALTAPALGALAMAARVRAPANDTSTAKDTVTADDTVPADSAPAPVAGLRLRRVGVAVALVTLLAGALSITFPWLAAREVAQAASTWTTNPAGASSELRLARSLNPLSDQADVTAGAIAERRHEWLAMRRAFVLADQRNPISWYTHLELSIAELELGHRQAALLELARARSLDPLEPALALVGQGIARPKTFDPGSVDRLFLDED
jgi:hypothetical protein